MHQCEFSSFFTLFSSILFLFTCYHLTIHSIYSAKDIILAYRDIFLSLPAKFQYSSMLDIRFSAEDTAWLAASGLRPTVWLDLIRPNVHANTEFFMNSFKSTIIKYQGRPHFGKENIIGKRELQQCFPHFLDFIKIRKELDPDKIFANPYFESLFDVDSDDDSDKTTPLSCNFKQNGSSSMRRLLAGVVAENDMNLVLEMVSQKVPVTLCHLPTS